MTLAGARAMAALVAMLAAAPAAVAAGAAPAALPPGLAQVFARSGVPLAHVSVVVQDTAARAPIIALNAGRLRSPASVMKLVTTWSALNLLGPDYRWRTEVWLGGPLEGGVLHGNLVVKGYGDPSITVEQLQALAAELRANGLDAIDGDLVLDRSFFRLPPFDPGAFDSEPEKPYNVGPDALLVNFKAIHLVLAPSASDSGVAVTMEPALASVTLAHAPSLAQGIDCGNWRERAGLAIDDRGDRATLAFHGSYPASCGARDWWISVLDHRHYAGDALAWAFRAAGGRFDGALREGRAPAGVAPFATLASPPLYDVVTDINKYSNNVMAQQLFLTLATAARPPPATFPAAIGAVRRYLASTGLAMPGLVLVNGSGLSRSARATAAGLNRLLVAASRSNLRDAFANTLPVAATDGTLARRFRDERVAGQAVLKTGTLDDVRAIAGYVIDADDRWFSVVVLVNDRHAERASPALDALVEWVYDHGAAYGEARRR
ncbi:MAG: D-alanyl-D-alanine carboxypeptidase/D-alanyl-D-alanine-endopeptidase [Proteobacteria bacterium]|jgi:D-alanyl-D-alanine carboxypeptidase/D-alanyl-D-alanine-endopeptidase (penicillin-binding protein 4)|nr:D-alanyl-D-alanine carboxypeptidase/D-alanyl-D-alanine-endopeptidase [Pseudomonadota bacterium]